MTSNSGALLLRLANHYCFLPLYVVAGDHLLVTYLCPADIDPTKHAASILKRLVTRLRAVWPKTRIIVWADLGFCHRRPVREQRCEAAPCHRPILRRQVLEQ